MPNLRIPEKSIKEVAKNFYRVILPMPSRLEQVNVIVFAHEDGVTLFDTGFNLKDSFLMLEDSLKAIGRSVCDVDHVFITHYHADHCGMAGRIKEKSGAVIHMSEAGRQILQRIENEELLDDERRRFYLEQGIGEEKVDVMASVIQRFRRAIFPFEVDEYLNCDRKYSIGGTSFEVLPTPGHSRDHVCFFFRKEGILLSGDHVLQAITPNLAPDIFCPGFRSLRSFLDSLSVIREIPIAMILPAHGAPFSNLRDRVDEMIKHHEDRKNRILRSAEKFSRTAFEISVDIFGEDLSDFDLFLALNETYVHLVELVHEGIISKSWNGKWILYNVR